MLYCFADHVALPSSFSDTSKTNLGCCHARTQNRYAQQQQQLKRDEWRACPDESPSMHVQVDGIEFNHRNDRSFFFFFLGREGGDTGQATWMVCGDEGLNDWCPGRKSQWICGGRWKKSCLVALPGASGGSRRRRTFLESHFCLSSLPPDSCLREHIRWLSFSQNGPIYHPVLSSVVDSVVGSDTWVKPRRAAVDAASPATEVKSNIHFKIVLPFVCSEPLDQAERIFPVCADSFH